MRGKKSDPEFNSKFVSQSILLGYDTPDQIVQHAKKMMAEIDEEIKAMEAKKILRSKLLGVVLTFEKEARDKTQEAKLLPFYKLEYPEVCKTLCKVIRIKPMIIGGTLDPDQSFAIKQLIECKVLERDRVRNELKQGERFDDYLKFILHGG